MFQNRLHERSLNPKVLKDFYVNSGLKRTFFYGDSTTNFENLKNSLENLLKENLTIEFKKSKCKIFSFFSLFDRIFIPSPEKIALLEKPNHYVKYLENYEHSSPFTKPHEISNLINLTMEKLIDF